MPRIAPTSCQDGHVPVPRVTNISQFYHDGMRQSVTRALLEIHQN
jgi:hypothetical protein